MKTTLAFVIFLILQGQKIYGAPILFLRADNEEMRLVRNVVASDLRSHQISDFIIEKDTTPEDVSAALQKAKPRFVALLDNKALSLYRELQGKPGAKLPPAAASMALNLKKRLFEGSGVSGIVYEVPALTILTRFRSISGLSVQNVLAPYRSSDFKTSMAEAKQQLAKEGINLIDVDVDTYGKDHEALNKRMSELLTESHAGAKIDAILVPADNIILNKTGFAAVWLEKARSLKVPFLCNVEKFVSKEFDFCTFAAYPDLTELGHQYAEQIAEILDNSVSPDELGVDYIVSTKQAIYLPKVKKLGATPTEDRLSEVKVIE